MKSYLHGMLTGGLIVFSFMFLMGNKKNQKKQFQKLLVLNLLKLKID